MLKIHGAKVTAICHLELNGRDSYFVTGAADGSADSVTGPGPGAGGDRLAIASQKLKFLGSGE